MATFVPYISLSPHKVSLYGRYEGTFNVNDRTRAVSNENLLNNNQNGEISKKARKKIENAINWLLFTTSNKKTYSESSGKFYNFKIMFVTLTLSSTQNHSDNFIKKEMLNQFLTECRQQYKTRKYLWRAETQKNGNIHFHIVFNKFIPWLWIKSTWNRIQNKHGYIDKFAANQYKKHKNGFHFVKNHPYKLSYKKQYQNYKNGIAGDWYKPNSTDVHSIKKIKNIARYLSKYCTKNDENLKPSVFSKSENQYYKSSKTGEAREIEGNLWYLSKDLSYYKSVIAVADSFINNDIAKLYNKFGNKKKDYDYCTVYYLDYNDIETAKCNDLFNMLIDYTLSLPDSS